MRGAGVPILPGKEALSPRDWAFLHWESKNECGGVGNLLWTLPESIRGPTGGQSSGRLRSVVVSVRRPVRVAPRRARLQRHESGRLFLLVRWGRGSFRRLVPVRERRAGGAPRPESGPKWVPGALLRVGRPACRANGFDVTRLNLSTLRLCETPGSSFR